MLDICQKLPTDDEKREWLVACGVHKVCQLFKMNESRSSFCACIVGQNGLLKTRNESLHQRYKKWKRSSHCMCFIIISKLSRSLNGLWLTHYYTHISSLLFMLYVYIFVDYHVAFGDLTSYIGHRCTALFSLRLDWFVSKVSSFVFIYFTFVLLLMFLFSAFTC